jgi:hypothetical protein
MRTYGFEKRKRPKLLGGGDGVVPISIGSKGKKPWGGGLVALRAHPDFPSKFQRHSRSKEICSD